MNKAQRVEAAIKGQAVDRIPFSVWYHLSHVDQNPVALAEETAALGKKYDYDFFKMMPFGLYGVEDLGARLDIFAQRGKPVLWNHGPINKPEDYFSLQVIPAIQGTYGKQLEFTSALRKLTPVDTPMIQTIFSPLTTLHKLAGDRLLEDLKVAPIAVRHALSVITEITNDFVNENIKRGVDGFFFATQEARSTLLPLEDFRRFAEPYDLQVINNYADRTWFNVLHLHGLDVYFEELADKYPVNVINWHDRDTAPTLAEARKLTSKTFLAGIASADKLVDGKVVRDDIIEDGTPESIIAHIREAIAAVDGKGLMIGPGCCVGQFASEENLAAVRKAVEL